MFWNKGQRPWEIERNKTIVELRTKLEIRSLFLRFSLALNVAMIILVVNLVVLLLR